MAGEPKVRWHTREDSGLVIDRRGRWFHDGEPIEHPNIVEAFNRGLRVQPDGRVQLHFGHDWAFVQVEQCPFIVVAVDDADERLSIRLSDRTAEWLEPSTLSLDDEAVLVVRVKGGLSCARFSRDAQFQLAERFVQDGQRLSLRVGEALVPLPFEV